MCAKVIPTIMQPMYLKELYGAMLPGVKKIACKRMCSVEAGVKSDDADIGPAMKARYRSYCSNDDLF